MTRAGKERAQEAASNSVASGNSGKRKGNFDYDAGSSGKKMGKHQQSNSSNTTTIPVSSKGGEKGEAKAESQQQITQSFRTCTSIDVMDVGNFSGTNSKSAETTYGEQNHETDDRSGLKSPLAGIKPTHSDRKEMAVMDKSSDINDGGNDKNDFEDDMMDPEDLDDYDGTLLDSSVGDLAEKFYDIDNDDDYERYEQDGEYGMHDPFNSIQSGTSGQQFRAILENLKNTDDQSRQLKTLQKLAETLSISNEETLAGYFPCDAFAQELVKIMKGSTGSGENNDMCGAASTEQPGVDDPQIMVLACRCISNLLDVFPSAAPRVLNYGIVGVLCEKLRSIQYIDLAEQALETLKEIANQAPMAVIQNGGLGVAFMYFDFFNIHSQRTALQMASQCMRFINIGLYHQLLEALPTLTNTLNSSDRTIIEHTCRCWARLSENYKSTPTELEKVLSTDTLNTMMGLFPVPGNANASRSTTFNDVLRVFLSVAKASPTLGIHLLHQDIIGSFYQVLTGTVGIPTSPTPLITLDNTWHYSLDTILNIIIDLLPPLPKDQEFDWNRFKKMEPIAFRTRQRTTQQAYQASLSTYEAAPSSSSTAIDSPSTPDLRTELLGNHPHLLQRIGVILFPLLLEIFFSTVNLTTRQLVTHTLVKLIFFMDGDSLKIALHDVPLAAFLADLLAHQEHSAFVVDALFQAEFLLKKLPNIYATLFQREGVYHGIKALANQKMMKDDAMLNMQATPLVKGTLMQDNTLIKMHVDKKSGRYDTMQRPTTYSLSTLSSIASLTRPTNDTAQGLPTQYNINQTLEQHNSQQLINGIRSGTGHGLLQQFIIQQAQNHIKDYGKVSRGAQKNGTDSLQVLKRFANDLAGTPDDSTSRKVLENLVTCINSTTVGISGFEILQSGILEALLGYLTLQQGNSGYASPLVQRRQTFYTVFLETLELDPESGLLVSPALRLLIQRLTTLLTRFERFEVELPLGSSKSSSNMHTPAQWATKQIRLRLQGQGLNIPSQYQNLTVTAQAVSNFHAVENFLLARIAGTSTIQNKHKGESKQSDSKKLAPSGFVDAMDIDKATLEEKDTSNQGLFEKTPTPSTSVTGSPVGSSASTSSYTDTAPLITTQKAPNVHNRKLKIQFFINDTMISNDASLYGAIHQSKMRKRKDNGSRVSYYNIWTAPHVIIYKCVSVDDGENNTEKMTANHTRHSDNADDDKNDTCTKILQLLKEFATISQCSKLPKATATLVPMTDFVNRKLTNKMQRQLEEPLIVACACLPDWVTYCMIDYPFLFPFDVRYLYLQSTSFGISRLISNWQSLHRRSNNTRDGQYYPEGGSVSDTIGFGGGELLSSQSTVTGMERRKVQVRRDQILDEAIKCMSSPGNSKSVLEIGYMDEEGTGLGPTLEFYALVSKKFCQLSTGMWRQVIQDDPCQDDDNLGERYVVFQQGLFPESLSKQMDQKSRRKVVRLFKTLGRFVAKSILDSRIIDIPFNEAFFKSLFYDVEDPLELVMDIDPVLGKSISHLQSYVDKKRMIENDDSMAPEKRDKVISNIEIDGTKIDELCLDFTLPGKAEVDLKRNGSKIPVTIWSVEEYIQLLADMIAGSGVNDQLSAFRDGFNELFSIDILKILTCQELVSLFGSSTEDWSYSTLTDAIKADHGFTMDSVTIKNLLNILSEMDIQEQREFLQFTTGSPRLPIGGWKSMRPMFTVVKKNYDAPFSPDDYLPSVMTCANYLKMPDYSSKDIMRMQLLKSMLEGKNCFLLS